MNKNLQTKIIKKIEEHRNIFISGPAGVGKTTLTQEIASAFDNVVVLAFSGIAAANIGGQTIHSFFQLPLYSQQELNPLYRKKLQTIAATKLIVIDEVSMMPKHVLDWIEERISEAGSNATFLFVGDYYQLSPIATDGAEPEYAFESEYWQRLNVLNVELNIIKRTKNHEFMEVLKDIRVANVTPAARAYLRGMNESVPNAKTATQLYSTNKKVEEVNSRYLNQLPGDIEFFPYKQELFLQTDDAYFQRFIKNLPITQTLKLKPGAQIILTFNNKDAGIYNGKKTEIQSIDDGLITTVDGYNIQPMEYECLKFTSTYNKNSKKTSIKEKKVGVVYQYPIKLAYALTIHKSQGMSIDGLIVDLTKTFAAGQAYVAISRAVDPANTQLILPTQRTIEDLFFHDEKVAQFYAQIDYEIVEEESAKVLNTELDMELLLQLQNIAKNGGTDINSLLRELLPATV